MKKRKTAHSGNKVEQEERGYRVVDMQGKRMMLPIEGGITEKEANRISASYILPTKVIRIEDE